jgi:F-type H+-transporting ATPase subunit a
MISPLEQFKILVIMPVNFLGNDISITNATIYLGLVAWFIYILMKRGTVGAKVIPNTFQRIAEIMYMFIHNLVKQQAGIKSLKFFPIFFVLFYIILFLNLIGLTPYGFTCTSQASYTFLLGFGMFIGIVIIGIVVQKVNFIKQFIPATTGPIVPLLIVIEIFSYLLRPFSLSIRLFANMLAGHTLLHILASFGMSMLKIDIVLALIMALPIIAICVLEFGIAFLQAYVFVVLLSIYMKESNYGH